MKRNFAIRRLLAILVVAGLVLAPLARAVMATTTPETAMTMASQMADHVSMSAMDGAMADHMSCCPSNAPAVVDCDQCVFMAGCMSACTAGLSAAKFEYLPIISATLPLLRDDARLVGLGRPPPEHPPRVLV
ncbi:MAG: hypothetical protein HY852_06725 [Bradyrhizobium sp.]|uniref:hypothetical protein n=1 Tax=Bradyrhizobium sp. TaxID=376 RepID=UPI0025BD6CAC|nr:hypothetical protein [Bradyrhizobium sp.]MBI5261496.1 hypothetical protein [Bradyrhizobium sp.]